MDTKKATATDTRECPFCAEIIKAKAVKCKHCGSILTEQAMSMFLHEISRLQASGASSQQLEHSPPSEAATTIVQGDPAKSPDSEISVDSSVRFATIIFADVSGFTHMSTKLEPEEMSEIMNALFSDLAGAIERFGGQVDKYIGDCVMAVWGTDGYREDDALRATSAAVSMIHRVKLRAQRLSLPLSMHVGVNTGRVIFGALGKGQGAAPTVLGDAVNLSSRLCSKASSGEVYVSEATWQRLGDRFSATPVELELKGLGIVRAYKVEPVRGKSHVTKHVVTGFLVRESEAMRIRNLFESVREHKHGGSTGVLVVGHGGTGKSRLCDYALHQYSTNLKSLFGQAVPSDSPVFGVLVNEWLRDILGGSDAAAIDRFLSERPDLLPFRDALRLFLTTTEELGQKPQAIQRLDVELARFFVAAAQPTPFILVGADIQWADKFSIDFCIAVASEAENVAGRVALLLDGRPGEHVERIQNMARVDVVQLQPLTQDETEKFLGTVIETLPPATWIKALRDRTGGVILHMSQVLSAMAEEGVLEEIPQTGKWRFAGTIGDIPVPQSLADLIWLRIEHLPTWPREVLLHSSVCGIRFPGFMLHYAMDRSADDIAPTLQDLQSDEFLYMISDIVAFEHGSIRETARRMLLKNERRKIAERILQSLGDTIWSDLFRPLAPELYRDAGREMDLRRFLSNEAYRLVRAFRLQEARQILEHVGRDPWPDNPEGRRAQGAYLTAEARLAEAERKFDRSFDCLRQAADLYQRTGEISAEFAKTLGLLGRLAAKREDWETAVESTQRALEMSRALNDDGGTGIHTFMLGWFAELREDWPEAIRYYEQSLPLQKNERGLRIVYGSIARAALELGDLEKARRRIEESLSIANKDGCLAWNPHAYVSILRTVGRVDWQYGEWERSLEYLQFGLNLARATGDDEAKNFILFPLAHIAMESGAQSSARVFAEEALKAARKLHSRRWEKKLTEFLEETPPFSVQRPAVVERLKLIEESLADPPPPRESLKFVRQG